MGSEALTCAIVGFGRFGQLLARILREEFSVLAYDRQPDHATAREIGAEVVSLATACAADALFFCVPISQLESAIREARPHLHPGTVIMDTCSVKLYPIEVMRRELPGDVEVLGTHPLFGPDSAKDGIRGLRIVFCPLRVSATTLNFWRSFWERRGVRVLEMSPDEHDRQAAYSQGITHFVGRVLGELRLEPGEITTKGFEAIRGVIEQTTHDTWQLFHDLQHYNPYTPQMREDLIRAFTNVMLKLYPDDPTLKALRRAQRARRRSKLER
ncbi:MAG: prephenate dehydrogenase/arogenate dehydrogenase family protein [Blastocatellia bacterium]|nr:prephenate dehydrogenase/arogenate dehydrogenase family protein [Blastocatellia bacterium]MCS7157149.1 prephenate dehydrogenase/arogenate dehydrogenase family protein [Blastocatellia bacterium]MCX7752388.1 prephenate dehydrogenase/arogenate dehydrogenase family protein [Blastocatellia bacterium]MDW8167271.1 prephenate dehydrogenase/arogenate dehydrogenase family protein [Acidobacteriota bacterium]